MLSRFVIILSAAFKRLFYACHRVILINNISCTDKIVNWYKILISSLL
ncbi:protein of unknown function [Shewanella benthica]|uniref:Uncharacterized protein n=1 Tax=Shewanella benthica TaxID=43661 RepID=A0A330M6Z8_9GAMM|nr:protein of unknown function [Shewanella benthica]